MKIISRAEAKTAGLKRYFTDVACKYGHIAERTVCDYCCVECSRLKSSNPKTRIRRRKYMAAFQRNYRSKHPDRIQATEQKRDKDERAAARRSARADGRENHRDVLSRSFQKHKAKRMAETKAWCQKHKEALARYMRPIKVMRRAAEGRFDTSDIVRMLTEQGGVCVACRVDISTNYHVDHMTPLSRGGTHWPSNLQLLCGPCNRSKNTKTMSEWISWKRTFQARAAVPATAEPSDLLQAPPYPSPSCR